MRKLMVFTAVIFSASIMFAESVKCENENGSCEFLDDGSFTCQCNDNSGWGGDGIAGSPTDEEVELPTNEECLEWVEDMCGLPEGAETCENPAGQCIVYAEGYYDCMCEDGSYGGTGGGETEPGDPGVSPDVDGGDSTEPEPVDEDLEVPDEYPTEECVEDKDCPEKFICVEGWCQFDYENVEKPVCAEVLVETCGTEAPNINDICDEKSLPYCTDAYSTVMDKCEGVEIPADKIKELEEGKWNEYGRDIADCCRDYEYAKTFLDELLECLKTKECNECYEQYEEAVDEADKGDSGNSGSDTGDTGNTGDTDNQEETGELEDDSPKEKSDSTSTGCSAVAL
ncbi:MAG TPA: hypothetical protein VLJ60_11335 [bacterium]|nr:hypothetical protein [bacterium]